MANTEYRVVYGETRPAWERRFPTKRAARSFAKAQKKLGDTIFAINRVSPDDPPQSIAAAIEAAAVSS